MKSLLLIPAVVLMLGCSGDKSIKVSSGQIGDSHSTEIILPNISGIDGVTLQNIVDKADQLDFIFSELPVSMNQDEKAAILQNLAAISKIAVKSIPSGCKPLARLVYNGGGEIIFESDLYLSESCQFVVFLKDEKRLFGNELVPQGIDFYNAILAQVQGAAGQ